jgi:ribosome recycling factor
MDEDEILLEAEDKMDKSLEAFQKEILHIRTGRASVGLIEHIEVEAYESKMRLDQMAKLNAPEARLLTVQPFDKSQIHAIEKAITNSGLELNPANDGTLIRIPMPELSEERRRDYVKLVSKMVEEARVSIRNIRRHEMDNVKKLQKDGDLPEDDAHRVSDLIQKLTDQYIGKVETAFKAKEADIMEV